ncbi:hypothetical protein SNEBB_007457 [Seison nebaliae]|nr:hypothetical protein SNEBB_007457 [Seison nebaliae]
METTNLSDGTEKKNRLIRFEHEYFLNDFHHHRYEKLLFNLWTYIWMKRRQSLMNYDRILMNRSIVEFYLGGATDWEVLLERIQQIYRIEEITLEVKDLKKRDKCFLHFNYFLVLFHLNELEECLTLGNKLLSCITDENYLKRIRFVLLNAYHRCGMFELVLRDSLKGDWAQLGDYVEWLRMTANVNLGVKDENYFRKWHLLKLSKKKSNYEFDTFSVKYYRLERTLKSKEYRTSLKIIREFVQMLKNGFVGGDCGKCGKKFNARNHMNQHHFTFHYIRLLLVCGNLMNGMGNFHYAVQLYEKAYQLIIEQSFSRHFLLILYYFINCVGRVLRQMCPNENLIENLMIVGNDERNKNVNLYSFAIRNCCRKGNNCIERFCDSFKITNTQFVCKGNDDYSFNLSIFNEYIIRLYNSMIYKILLRNDYSQDIFDRNYQSDYHRMINGKKYLNSSRINNFYHRKTSNIVLLHLSVNLYQKGNLLSSFVYLTKLFNDYSHNIIIVAHYVEVISKIFQNLQHNFNDLRQQLFQFPQIIQFFITIGFFSQQSNRLCSEKFLQFIQRHLEHGTLGVDRIRKEMKNRNTSEYGSQPFRMEPQMEISEKNVENLSFYFRLKLIDVNIRLRNYVVAKKYLDVLEKHSNIVPTKKRIRFELLMYKVELSYVKGDYVKCLKLIKEQKEHVSSGKDLSLLYFNTAIILVQLKWFEKAKQLLNDVSGKKLFRTKQHLKLENYIDSRLRMNKDKYKYCHDIRKLGHYMETGKSTESNLGQIVTNDHSYHSALRLFQNRIIFNIFLESKHILDTNNYSRERNEHFPSVIHAARLEKCKDKKKILLKRRNSCRSSNRTIKYQLRSNSLPQDTLTRERVERELKCRQFRDLIESSLTLSYKSKKENMINQSKEMKKKLGSLSKFLKDQDEFLKRRNLLLFETEIRRRQSRKFVLPLNSATYLPPTETYGYLKNCNKFIRLTTKQKICRFNSKVLFSNKK